MSRVRAVSLSAPLAVWLPSPLAAVFVVCGMAALVAGAVAAVVRWLPLRWGPGIAFVAATPVLTAGAAAGAGLLGLAERWSAAAACAAVAALLASFQAPLFVGRGRRVRGRGDRGDRGDRDVIVVMTSNLLYRDGARAASVVEAVRRRRVDVLAVQELTAEMATAMRCAGLGEVLPHAATSPRDGPGGAAVWSRFPIVALDAPDGFAYPPVVVRVDTGGRDVVVASVHPVSPWRTHGRAWSRELRAMAEWLDGFDGPAVIAGDFNSTTDHRQFRDILRRGYADAVADVGAGFRPTWPVRRWGPPYIAIDHILIRGGPRVRAATTFEVEASDHRAIVATIALDPNPTGGAAPARAAG